MKMAENNSYSDDLKTIRKIMEGSSRFLSLSGLSGVFAGLTAIAGAVIAWLFILPGNPSLQWSDLDVSSGSGLLLIIDVLIVLIAAISVSFIFSYRKSVRTNTKFWTPVSRRMLFNMVIPLATGALIVVVFIFSGDTVYVAPAMLVFYGLALVNAGKFTFGEIHYLGLLEILTGLVAFFFPGLGLYFWVAGFGFLHIFYGLVMYRKYE